MKNQTNSRSNRNNKRKPNLGLSLLNNQINLLKKQIDNEKKMKSVKLIKKK